MNAQRTTRGVRWQLVAGAHRGLRACPDHRRRACRPAEPQGRRHRHGADRELGPCGDLCCQQRRARLVEADRQHGESDRGLRPRSAARPGIRVGQPGRHLLSGQRPGRHLREGGRPRPARQPEERQVVLPVAEGGLHLQGPPVRGAEGLLDARARDQHRVVEGREADERGPARRRGSSLRPSRRSSRGTARSASAPARSSTGSASS